MVAIESLTVVPKTVDAGIVEAGIVVDVVCEPDLTLTTCELEIEVVTVVGAARVSRDTVCEIVEAEIVVGDMVLPGMVVVNVTVTPPSALAGMALPTPVAVYCEGMGRVAVLGISAELAE